MAMKTTSRRSFLMHTAAATLLIPRWTYSQSSSSVAEPARTDTLVFPDQETDLPGFTIHNWTYTPWTYNNRWPDWESSPKGPPKIVTIPSSVIVIHETGSPSSSYSNKDTGVHFLVCRDGLIVQLAPLTKKYKHCPLVVRSIGIEVANGTGVFPFGNMSFTSGPDKIKTRWRSTKEPYLHLPTEIQARALYALIERLCAKFSIPRQVANAAIAKNYFILTAQGQRWGAEVDNMLENYKGIMSHSIKGDGSPHNDGGSLALYTHLRFLHTQHDYAWCLMKELMAEFPAEYKSIPSSLNISTQQFQTQTWVFCGEDLTPAEDRKCKP